MKGEPNMAMALKCYKKASDSDSKDGHYKVGYFL
jgi:TPR repeat protein